MGKRFFKWASLLAVSLAFMWMAVPLMAYADDGTYAISITVSGGKGGTVALSVNGEKQVEQDIPKAGGVVSAQAQQGDVIAVAVAPKTPNSYMVESFTATDSNGTAIECQSEKTVNDASSWYSSYEYTFTMPASNVAATCVLARSTWTQLTAYCAMGWEDFDFALTDESDELVVPTLTGISQQGVPCRKYIIQHGSYKYAMSNVKAGSTIDSGELVLNPGSSSLNWNPLTVMVEPADVKGLGLFGVAGCTCTRADGEEEIPIASSVDESGIYTATFLLRGGIPGVGSTDYKVNVTPEDERCSVTWKTGWEDNYNYSDDSINVTSQSTESCKAKAFVRASGLMEAQGDAIIELGAYKDPADYLEAQQAEIAQAIAAATEAIKAAETEEAVAEQLASAKQALDAVETAEQAQAAAAPVAQAIAALPAADALTAENADAVKAARAAYDALTAAEKAAVGEAAALRLQLAEAVVEKLGLEQQVAELEGQVTTLSGEKEALQGQLTEAEAKVKAAEGELAKAKAAPAAKKANTVKVTVKAKTVKAKKLKKKAQKFKALTVKNAKGKVTYKKVKVNKKKFAGKFTVNKKTGKITVKKGVKKGTYKITVKVTVAGDKTYKAKSVKKTVKVTVE